MVKGGAGFEACAFLLEQDVRPITEEEFYVTDEWIGMWKPIAEISGKMRGYTCRIWRPSIGGVAKPRVRPFSKARRMIIRDFRYRLRPDRGYVSRQPADDARDGWHVSPVQLLMRHRLIAVGGGPCSIRIGAAVPCSICLICSSAVAARAGTLIASHTPTETEAGTKPLVLVWCRLNQNSFAPAGHR